MFTRQVILSACLLQAAQSFPSVVRNDSFVAHQYQLYPENLDVNSDSGHIAFGSMYNCTVDIYDPYKRKTTQIIDLPGISYNPALHVGGVKWNASTNHILILSNAGDAFNTFGQNISGDNFLVNYDLNTSTELWRYNITELSQNRYAGFQDLTVDDQGRIYVIGTWPSSITRIDSDGRNAVAWYGPTSTNHTINGLTGVANIGQKFLAPEGGSGKLYKFDMGDEKGKATEVPLSQKLLSSDGIHLPPIYNNKVLLVSVHPTTQNGVMVVMSRDGSWDQAEYLGFVQNQLVGTDVTAVFSLDNHIYMLPGYFADNGLKAGNRTNFPMTDITTLVDKLVRAAL